MNSWKEKGAQNVVLYLSVAAESVLRKVQHLLDVIV